MKIIIYCRNEFKMEKDILCNIIRESQDFIPNISLYERPVNYETNGNYVFVGVRQSGKSYMIYQRIQQLLREGHSIKNIVYINFDDGLEIEVVPILRWLL